MKEKITTAEKHIIKGLLLLHIERKHEPVASEIEYEVMRITGENHEEHRYAVEDYIQMQIEKMEVDK